MAIDTLYDKKRNLRIHTVKSSLSKEALFAYLEDMYSSPGFDSEMNTLWDLSEAGILTADLTDAMKLKSFVEQKLSLAKNIRAALVVTAETDKALAEMFGTLLDGSKISVKRFCAFEEALCWVTYKGET